MSQNPRMPAPTLSTHVASLFTGRVRPMPGDGRSTGICKQRVEGPLRVAFEGLEGDQQADRRLHGGPEKALHQFPIANYARLAGAFPDLAPAFVAGAIGENLSTPALDESQVCVGDVFALGTARVQLSQPRRPCWKIDARFGHEGIAAFVETQALAGWYYRVLEPGTVRVGDELALLDRTPDALTLQQFNSLARLHRPQAVDLMRAANLPGLTVDWAERFRARALWLHHNTPARGPLADDP
jgi:MOSC domain-containing protein YiiM